jgi:TrmH family RNA methyltransferase
MLPASQIKFIRSLAQKKERDATGLFVAEGFKTVGDLAPYFKCRLLAATKEHLDGCSIQADTILQASPSELDRASLLKTPQGMLALFEKPAAQAACHVPANELTLALDGLQNPGNLGTIIRLADWFGIRQLFCSPDTADAYGPKTVQATMGALGRVQIHYTDLESLLLQAPASLSVFGTFLDGEPVYDALLPQQGIIVMGSEGRGISDKLTARITKRLFIPPFPAGAITSESLNVAVAAAIICSEFRRRNA